MVAGIKYTHLTAIYADPSNSGYAGPYKVQGVAKHQNDKGMKQIAGAISAQFDQLAPWNAHMYVYGVPDDGIFTV